MGKHSGKQRTTSPPAGAVMGQQRPKETPPARMRPEGLGGDVALALACGLVAAVAMFANLSYGLPLQYHPDEGLKVELVMRIPQWRVPIYFAHPHFMLYFAVPFALTGKLIGVSPHLAARASVAFLGVATACLLFFIGKALAGRAAGVAAALVFATAPLVVVPAHDFKEDIPLAFWLTVQLFFLVRYLQGERLRDLYISAIALGGAMGTKYTGFVAAALLAGGVLVGPSSGRRWKTLGIAALLTGFMFLLCTPTLLLAPNKFLVEAGFEGQHAIFGHGIKMGVDPEGKFEAAHTVKISPLSYLWSYHLRYSLLPGISAAGIILALIGAIVAFANGPASWRLVASGMVFFYFLLETLPLKPPPFAARYMVTVLPYAALLCGRAVAFAFEGPMSRKSLIGLVAAATLVFNGVETLRQVRAMQPETRDEARAWIYEHIPPGSRLILPGVFNYTPLRYASRPPGFPYDLDVFQEASFAQILSAAMDPQAYLIVSSFSYQRYLDHPDLDPDAHQFYRMLFERYTPLAVFKPPFTPLGFHNPTIQIFRLTGPPPPSAGAG